MGNVNGKEDGGNGAADEDQSIIKSPSNDNHYNHHPNHKHTPARSSSLLLFAPQVPVAPLQRPEGPPFQNQMWRNDSPGVVDHPPEQGIPTIIFWNYGGNEVFVEGSWDNWMSRKLLQRSGKDHSILMVLPSGIYHYKFIVDGEWRYIPDLPCATDEVGHICNLLDVDEIGAMEYTIVVAETADAMCLLSIPQTLCSSFSLTHRLHQDGGMPMLCGSLPVLKMRI
ncbi:SNF1-related protein kinase regulatory subunit beta-1 isoform X3 [Euphorbia lathyris]|uniref:SNF1-related protein kinase regulatory subunit beta-1 isoform X3 n=1 Tax=Euphorbia lathyris TaxID=212925 RepID=UPI0033142764